MTTTIRVTVTQDDIDCGTPQDNHSCPIALALTRLFPDVKINVGAQIAEIDWTSYQISKRAQEFIDAFDADEIVSPATFVLRPYNQ